MHPVEIFPQSPKVFGDLRKSRVQPLAPFGHATCDQKAALAFSASWPRSSPIFRRGKPSTALLDGCFRVFNRHAHGTGRALALSSPFCAAASPLSASNEIR